MGPQERNSSTKILGQLAHSGSDSRTSQEGQEHSLEYMQNPGNSGQLQQIGIYSNSKHQILGHDNKHSNIEGLSVTGEIRQVSGYIKQVPLQSAPTEEELANSNRTSGLIGEAGTKGQSPPTFPCNGI